MNPPTEWPRAAAAAALIGVLCAVTAAVTVGGNPSDYAWLEATARTFMVAAPIAVGFYARRDPATERFGTLLAAAGGGWFLTTLSGSDHEVVYSIGRVSGWIVEAVLVYVLLAFPSGRLEPVDRRIVIAAVALVGILYLPTALLVAG